MRDYNSIPEYHHKTNKKFNNNYEILNINNDDFGIVCYYLTSNKIQLIIRKFNNTSITGWSYDIQIKLYSIENNHEYEMLHIGSSIQNSKKCNLFTKIKLSSYTPKLLKIPHVIFQTYKNNQFHNESHKHVFHHLLESHPHFDYYFFNDKQCIDFIKKYAPEYIEAYHTLYPVAYKADLFRYILIYIKGGIYLDHKYILRTSFERLLSESCNQFYCHDVDNSLLFNSIIISTPENPQIKELIEKINNNIKTLFYGKCPLHPTGPRLFGEIMDHSYSHLQHVVNDQIKDYKSGNVFIKKNNQLLLTTSYDNYYFNKNHRNEIKNDYDYCFKNKLIYIQNQINIENYNFGILYPNLVYFQVLILEKKEKSIVIQTIIQGLKESDLKPMHKFIYMNTNKEYELKKCYNSIIEIDV